jgi:phosphoserine phosphatase
MKKLYLARHGETEWNADNRVQGSIDIPLSDKGREQAKWLVKCLKKNRLPDVVFSSDLSRAKETADIITSGTGIPKAVSNPLLREINCGKWEGLSLGELEKNYPGEFESWRLNADYKCPEGESVLDVKLRIERFLDEQDEVLSKAESVLIVAHGLFNRAFLSHLMSLGLQECRYFEQDNTALNIFVWGRFMPRVVAWNYTPFC